MLDASRGVGHRLATTVLGYPFMRMRRGSWAPLLCFAAMTATAPVQAQSRPGAAPEASPPAQGPGTSEDQTKAQQHFQRAKELYQSGSYREAIVELEIAHKLDPGAKDLVINLAIVHEKLGKFDEAIAYLRKYVDMEGVTPQERAKAEAMIRRVEGAKRELPPPVAPTPPPPPEPAPQAEPQEPPPHGRVDALTVTAGTLAAVGLVGGGVLGAYALATRPSDFVTGRDGSFAALQDKTETAHTAAILADVSLGVGVVATLVTAWLYFGRTRDPEATPAKASSGPRVGAGPVASGGALFVAGSFE